MLYDASGFQDKAEYNNHILKIAGAQHGEDTPMRDKPISIYSSRIHVTERDVEAKSYAGQRIAGVIIWRNY